MLKNIEKPWIGKDANDNSYEDKWLLFLNDFKIKNNWEYPNYYSCRRKAFKAIAFTDKFSYLHCSVFDHVYGWRTEKGDYIITSQPYLSYDDIDESVHYILRDIIKDKDYWKICVENGCSIDIDFTHRYNWHNESTIFLTFRWKSYPIYEPEKQKLVVNVHKFDKDNNEIIIPYETGLAIL